MIRVTNSSSQSGPDTNPIILPPRHSFRPEVRVVVRQSPAFPPPLLSVIRTVVRESPLISTIMSLLGGEWELFPWFRERFPLSWSGDRGRSRCILGGDMGIGGGSSPILSPLFPNNDSLSFLSEVGLFGDIFSLVCYWQENLAAQITSFIRTQGDDVGGASVSR